jgi:paraquat-inducible protein B
MHDEPPFAPPIGQAATRRARRVSVIWIIPLVAVLIGAWLAWTTLSKRGPMIAVSFESGEGLQPGQSQLKFKDIVFGTVQSLDLAPDHQHVNVTIQTTRAAEPLLRDQTSFWVVKPRLFAGNISGLETLLSGSYVAMLPGRDGGNPQRSFTGLENPPVLQANVPGRTFLLKADRLGSISLGAPVFYRDLSVGEVLGWDLQDMAKSVTVHVFVRAPFDEYVTDRTRFWNASGLSVSLGGAGIQVQLESIKALVLGGIAFDTADPTGEAVQTATASVPSAVDHVFPLFPDHDAAKNASYSRVVDLISYFPGSVRGIAEGSEVQIHGLRVGHVLGVRLSYDPANEAIVAPVRYEVEPERVLGVGAKEVFPSVEDAVDAMVKKGFRASLQSTSLITGQQSVALELVPNAPPATVTKDGEYFVMPTTGGGGLADLQSAATTLLEQVNTIPFSQIGKSLDGILKSVNTAADGPELKKAITELSATLASIQDVASKLDSGVSPAVKQLPALTTELRRTLANTDKLVQSVNSGYGDNTKFNHDVSRMIVQLNDTLRMVSSLADLLNRHPEALIKGRPAGGLE